jgi:hypothetical protein
MDRGKFIRCCRCNAIHRVTRFDNAPLYLPAGNGMEEYATDDWRAFMERHAGHHLEPLTETGEKFFPAGSPFDPMSVGYVEVTNGRERFVLRRARPSIQEPLSYELIYGRLADAGVTLEIQEIEIKKEMKNHFSWAPAKCPDDDKIDRFIALLGELVQTLDPSYIRISEYSDTDDAISYGVLDNASIGVLTQRCEPYFLPAELESLCRFVETHRDGCDVMTLVMRRRWAIEESIS